MYKVLIVDDEQNIRDRLAGKMPWGKIGFEVAGSAESGEEAWQQVCRTQPHVVLTDIRMPGMTGLELVDKVTRQFPAVKTAVMSAYDDFAYAKDAIRYGVKGYLLKPLIREEVMELFARMAKELAAEAAMRREETPDMPQATIKQAEPSPYIAEAARYIVERYKERILLEDVAKHLHINPNYFSTLFKRETGYNFIDYVNEIRIRRSMDLLLATGKRISDVAGQVGFTNFSYFNKIFKRLTGVTPQTYQESQGKAALKAIGGAPAAIGRFEAGAAEDETP